MNMRKDLSDKLTIDCEVASAAIVRFIRDKVNEGRKQGVLLGLSGGVDSAVVAVLASRAVGPANVYALHLYDRDSQKKSLTYAQRVAEKLGIHFEVMDMSKLAAGRRPAVVSPLPATANRIVIGILRFVSCWVFGESPFALDLRRQSPPRGRFRRGLYRLIVDRVGASFDQKHRLRRAILEDYALRNNFLLVGAANKSESMVGWFVKDGVDDLQLEPILGLYKTQVRQLARGLALPAEVIEQAPSPDMLKGLTDEMAIGFKYERLDAVLYVIENRLAPKAAYELGITPQEFEGIRTLNELSAWKRDSPHEYPAAQ